MAVSVAVVGATGAVGDLMRKVLLERDFPAIPKKELAYFYDHAQHDVRHAEECREVVEALVDADTAAVPSVLGGMCRVAELKARFFHDLYQAIRGSDQT